MTNLRLYAVLAGLAAGAALATFGKPDARVGFSSVVDLWTDVLRDADQAGMKITRVSDADEMLLGAELLGNALRSNREDIADGAYVTAVGQSLTPYVRRRHIAYEFHVLDSPQINAFALPGGKVVVMRGMLDFVQSEAELASVLGHEVSHIDLRHCIERYQYQLRAGAAIELLHRFATIGFEPKQELEADQEGERLSVEAGYDPAAASALFRRMKQHFGEPFSTRSSTPAGEAVQSVSSALADYFRSHPPSDERVAELDRMVAQNASRFAGKRFYVGAENLRRRIPRAQHQFE